MANAFDSDGTPQETFEELDGETSDSELARRARDYAFSYPGDISSATREALYATHLAYLGKERQTLRSKAQRLCLSGRDSYGRSASLDDVEIIFKSTLDEILLQTNRSLEQMFPGRHPEFTLFGDGSWTVEVDALDGVGRICGEVSGDNVQSLMQLSKEAVVVQEN